MASVRAGTARFMRPREEALPELLEACRPQRPIVAAGFTNFDCGLAKPPANQSLSSPFDEGCVLGTGGIVARAVSSSYVFKSLGEGEMPRSMSPNGRILRLHGRGGRPACSPR